MCFNNKETVNEVETERQVFDSSEEDEFRVEDADGNANNLLQISQQQQQPLAPVVKWERYLPVRSLKVLLVENDDSTRQIVTALLKNCSYEVTAVSDVIEGWRILEDENSCIDLVLSILFFKFYLPDESGDDLELPVSFNSSLPKPLPRNVTIRSIYGKTWKLALRKCGGDDVERYALVEEMHAILDSLLAKKEPLTEKEIALKDKLIDYMMLD